MSSFTITGRRCGLAWHQTIGRFILATLVIAIAGLPACAARPAPGQAVTATSRPSSGFERVTRLPALATASLLPPVDRLTATPAPIAGQQTVPSAIFTPPVCDKGQVQTGQVDSSLLREPLDYRIYLPPCYAIRPDQRYPVLYMFHGQGFDDQQWERVGITTAADQLIMAGTIPPLIIVMPYDRTLDDITTSKFEQVFMKTLVPFVDATYRTLPDRQHRAVGGLSRGGALAIHFGIRYWHTFGAVGAHSPAIFVSDAPYLARWLDDIPRDAVPRVYIDIGDNDSPQLRELAAWFEKLLDERDIAHEWRLYNGDHSERYWRAHVENYLLWYSQGW